MEIVRTGDTGEMKKDRALYFTITVVLCGLSFLGGFLIRYL